MKYPILCVFVIVLIAAVHSGTARATSIFEFNFMAGDCYYHPDPNACTDPASIYSIKGRFALSGLDDLDDMLEGTYSSFYLTEYLNKYGTVLGNASYDGTASVSGVTSPGGTIYGFLLDWGDGASFRDYEPNPSIDYAFSDASGVFFREAQEKSYCCPVVGSVPEADTILLLLCGLAGLGLMRKALKV